MKVEEVSGVELAEHEVQGNRVIVDVAQGSD